MPGARRPRDFYPQALRGRDRRLNARVYQPSTTASIAPASPPRKRPMRKPSTGCSPRSTARGAASRPALSCRRRASPRPTGGCSPRWCASTRSMSGISSATCAASPTIRTCRTICAISTRFPGVAETVDVDHIKTHYYGSHRNINPTRHRAARPGARLCRAARPRSLAQSRVRLPERRSGLAVQHLGQTPAGRRGGLRRQFVGREEAGFGDFAVGARQGGLVKWRIT